MRLSHVPAPVKGQEVRPSSMQEAAEKTTVMGYAGPLEPQS